MAQPNPRAQALTHYFSNEYDFEPENYIAGVILYKRRNAQGVVERIVVKHATLPLGGQLDREEEIGVEEVRNSRNRLFLVLASFRARVFPFATRECFGASEPLTNHALNDNN